MIKHLVCSSILLLLGHFCMGQFGWKGPAKALEAYRNCKTDTGRINLLLQIGEIYADKPGDEQHDLDTAAILFNQAKSSSNRLGYTFGIDHANRLLGEVMLKRQDYVSFSAWMANLNQYDRQDLTITAVTRLLKEPYRNKGRMDTAFSLVHRCLALGKKDTLLYDQTGLLLNMALVRYCDGNFGARPAPSPAWTAQAVLAGGASWLDPILDWAADELHNDPILINDMADLRKRLKEQYSHLNQQYMLDNIRSCFIQVIGEEANNNDYFNRYELAAKQFMLGVDFDRTKPQIELVSYYNAAYFFVLQNALHTALRYGLEAVRVLDQEKEIRVNSQLPYLIVGKIYYELNQPAQSMAYFRQGLARLRAQHLTPDGLTIGWITGTRIALDSAQAALEYLRDSIPPGELQDSVSQRHVADAKGECYYALGQYDKAEYWYTQAWNYSRNLKHYVHMSAAFYLGKIYVRTHQYEKAIAMLQPVIKDSSGNFMSIGTIKNAHYLLFQVDSTLGNYIESINHLHAYNSINDAIFNRARNDQVQDLTIQYASEQKDKSILLQKAELRQSAIMRNTLISGAILLALLLALVYSRYRIKHRSNRLLQERQDQIDSRNRELERMNQQQQLLNFRQQQLLVEKEWLMREIHHRVKNNLQIILSLLNMQAADLKDDIAYHAFGEATSRLQAISLIHQKLYRENTDMTTVSMREYITELIGFLQDSFQWGERIRFRPQVDQIALNVAQCVPVGLILNEAITNSIKYAFPELTKSRRNATAAASTPALLRQKGSGPEIAVALRYATADHIELAISDNGKGLPPEIDIWNNQSMGMELIRMLSEQLGGTLAVDSRQGLSISICFPVNEGPNSEAGLLPAQ